MGATKYIRITPPSLTSGWSCDAASPKEILLQIRYELEELLHRNGLSAEKLALDYLDLKNSSSLSKVRTGASQLSMSAAKKLDGHSATLGGPSVGGTFEALLRIKGARSVPRDKMFSYDVFLASPMAGIDPPDFEKQRDEALHLKEAIENFCGFRVYYAGAEIRSHNDFESTDLAAEINFSHLSASRFFVLVVTSELARPTSIWVEAGFAMALQIPSLYVVRSLSCLPFVMRTLNQHARPDLLPPVRIESLETNQKPSALIKSQGKKIFDRLDPNR
ncbi:MAG: hypothetical protein ACYDCC_10850 [Actinomycetota bacterium]